MRSPNRMRSACTTLVAVVGAPLMTGCALLQPPPVPRMPRLEWRLGSGSGDCTSDVARAHAAFAAAGAAGGDPAATAAAHASAASAMASYHSCLAQSSQH